MRGFDGLVPADLFNWRQLLTLRGAILILDGGFLVGFGTAYAGGCTSGHGIAGLAALDRASLVAVTGFFAGGLLATYLLLPLILWAREMVRYFILGSLFGVVLTKAEAVSWFRIQEMFRFESFHMYGILGSAVVVAGLSILLLQRAGARSLSGEPIAIAARELGRGYQYWIGGSLFGVGWAFTGACPGPLFALIGSGAGVFAAAVASALAGTWLYGYLRPHLPHY